MCIVLGGNCASYAHPVLNPAASYGYLAASYSVFVYGMYRKSRLVCVWLSDLDLSGHHLLV